MKIRFKPELEEWEYVLLRYSVIKKMVAKGKDEVIVTLSKEAKEKLEEIKARKN